MKRTSVTRGQGRAASLQPEYRFDYRQAKPNRFAGRRGSESVVVLLDTDVSKVFRTPDAVNAALRALISAVPGQVRRSRTRR